MDFRKHLFILRAIEQLNNSGNWTGRTHVQKSLFMTQALGKIPVPFQFVLYMHGPYSFEVDEELVQMKSYQAVISDPVSQYGVMLKPGRMKDYVEKMAVLSSGEEEAIRQVCQFVGRRGVAELEQLATAAWIMVEEKVSHSDEVARRLNFLKPHISVEAGQWAYSEVGRFLAGAIA